MHTSSKNGRILLGLDRWSHTSILVGLGNRLTNLLTNLLTLNLQKISVNQ